MLTEGKLITIDYTTNHCTIHIPVFDTVGNSDPLIIEGRILIQPGYFNNYKVGDLVWVDFVNAKINKPVVMGKIYQGPDSEGENAGGQLNVDTLNVTGNTATLPRNIKFTDSTDQYQDLQKIIDDLKQVKFAIDNTTDINIIEIYPKTK